MLDKKVPHDSDSNLEPQRCVAKALFLGNLVQENLFPYPIVDPGEAETLAMVIESIDRFMEGKGQEYRDYDVKGEQPQEYIDALKELGLFGLIIPEEYEGIGFCNKSYSRVVQQTSNYDGSTSLTVGAHSSIGMRGLLLFGNEEQKKRYLPALASGEMIAAFCLTEPGSGSDAASIKTSAELDGDEWVLSGEKIWITNGPFADFFTVFARTNSETGKLSAFLVERSFAGVSTGPKEDKMGIRASGTCSVFFDKVRVPAANMLGEEGKGFKIAMSILNSGRTGLGGGCVGAIKTCIRHSSKYANQRKQFGRSISEFALVKEKIGQMTVDCFAAESAVNMVAHYIDSKVEDFSIEAAMSKIFATEALWRAANESLQISGGNGFMREYPYERLVRDSRINLIFEGTNEILRLFIALSGLKDAGQYLKAIGASAAKVFNDPIKGFGVLTEYAQKKIAQHTSLGRDRLDGVHSALAEEGIIFERYTQEFAKVCEAVIKKYRQEIIGQQLISKRIADIAIDLFVGFCVLSRVSSIIEQKGVDDAALEISLAQLFTDQARKRMKANLVGVEKNADSLTLEIAEKILAQEKFPWDVMKA